MLFIQPRAITVVTYYKQTTIDEVHSYQGKAYTFTYTTWKGTCVALAHTSHLPPPDDKESETEKEQEQEEIELEPIPALPGFGFSLIQPY